MQSHRPQPGTSRAAPGCPQPSGAGAGAPEPGGTRGSSQGVTRRDQGVLPGRYREGPGGPPRALPAVTRPQSPPEATSHSSDRHRQVATEAATPSARLGGGPSRSSLTVIQSLSRVHLCDAKDGSTPGLPVLYHLPEFAQTHVH